MSFTRLKRLVLLMLASCPNCWGTDPAGTVLGQVKLTKADAVQDAVVYIPDIKGKSAASHKAVLSQRNKTLLPHVLPILSGTVVDFPNFDPIFHNVYSFTKRHEFDLGLYSKGEVRSIKFEGPMGPVDVFCAIHPQMHAVIMVLENPYFAVTDKYGRFSISNVPSGSHSIAVWHERYGKIEQRVFIKSDGATQIGSLFLEPQNP